MGLPPPPSYDDATAETKPLTADIQPPPAGTKFDYPQSNDANIQASAPTATNITVEHVRPSTPQVPDLFSTGAPGFWSWCCLGLFCPIPAAFFMGRRMRERLAWLKYGIPALIMIAISIYSVYQLYLWLPDLDYDYLEIDRPLDPNGYYVKVNDEACGYECVKGFQFFYLPLVVVALLMYQRRFFIGLIKSRESCCCSCLTVWCCPCLSFGQMGAYTEENPIQEV